MACAATTNPPPETTRRRILIGAFGLGFSCVITQVVLMREMFGVFAGNELVLGVVLGNWLLLLGLGAALGRWFSGRKNVSSTLAVVLIFTALLPPGQVAALRGLRQVVFLRGAAIGTMELGLTSLVVLLPYCLLAGFFLALACRALEQRRQAHGAGRVYAMDGVGSVAGGALFSFVLVLWLDHFAILCVPALLNLSIAAWCLCRDGPTPEPSEDAKRLRRSCFLVPAAVLSVAAGSLVWMIRVNPDAATTALQFPGQHLLFSGYSPYGRLAVTESGGQTNFFENGLLVATSPNIESAEETAHYAMAQRPGAKKVLLIGGLLSGTAREILRHAVARVDCVEMDPLVVRAGRAFLPGEFDRPRLRVFEVDARQYVRRSGDKYDVVIVALPDPATAQLNRFFTHEFFQETRRLLNPDGILSFAVGRYENYASPELSSLLSCARRTARLSFAKVRLIPGGRVYFLASDGPLTLAIAAALEPAGLDPRWVNRHYLGATLTPDRLADLDRAATQPAPINYDFKPVLYFLQLRHWASQFRGVSGWLTVLMLAAVAVYVFRLRGARGAIFASGFAGAALEVVLLLGMQVLAGAVYRQVALVVTLFMAGLAAGALGATRWLERSSPPPEPALPPGTSRRAGWLSPRPGRVLGVLALAIALGAVVLPQLLLTLARGNASRFGEDLATAIIALFTFSIAALAGAQFPVANALAVGGPNPAVRLYTADFVGASIGALLASTLLLPLIGVTGVCAIAGALNLLAALMVFRKGSFA